MFIKRAVNISSSDIRNYCNIQLTRIRKKIQLNKILIMRYKKFNWQCIIISQKRWKWVYLRVFSVLSNTQYKSFSYLSISLRQSLTKLYGKHANLVTTEDVNVKSVHKTMAVCWRKSRKRSESLWNSLLFLTKEYHDIK